MSRSLAVASRTSPSRARGGRGLLALPGSCAGAPRGCARTRPSSARESSAMVVVGGAAGRDRRRAGRDRSRAGRRSARTGRVRTCLVRSAAVWSRSARVCSRSASVRWRSATGPPSTSPSGGAGRYGGQARLAAGQVMLRARLDEDLAHASGTGPPAQSRSRPGAPASAASSIRCRPNRSMNDRPETSSRTSLPCPLQAPQGVLGGRAPRRRPVRPPGKRARCRPTRRAR
jgi:hypothetical protein